MKEIKTQFSCLEYEGKVESCETCPKKEKCTVRHYIQDLTAIRLHCKNCGKKTREEHIKFCPFCGVKA